MKKHKNGIRVLVCGAGSIGRRHITNLLKLGVSTSAWRARESKVEELADEFKISVFTNLETAIRECDAVVVATETHRHIEIALAAAKRHKHLFIEKPVSHNLNNIQQLEKIINKNSIIVEIGCMLRASPTLIRLKEFIESKKFGEPLTFRTVMGQRLDTWRPGVDYRESYSADQSRGGGALLDLIHQIDLVLYLFGRVSSLSCVNQTIGHLEIQAETLSNLILETEMGVCGQVQVDMISPVYRGQVEIVTFDAVLNWDIQTNVLTISQSQVDDLVIPAPNNFQRNDLFIIHMQHFLNRIKDPGIHAIANFADGVSALNTVLTAYQANLDRRHLSVT